MSDFTINGSHAVSVYTKREEIVCGIFENELDSLSEHNTFSMIFFAIGSFAVGKVIDSVGAVPFGQYYVWVALVILFYALGGFFFWKKRGLTDKIKKKSKPIGIPNV